MVTLMLTKQDNNKSSGSGGWRRRRQGVGVGWKKFQKRRQEMQGEVFIKQGLQESFANYGVCNSICNCLIVAILTFFTLERNASHIPLKKSTEENFLSCVHIVDTLLAKVDNTFSKGFSQCYSFFSAPSRCQNIKKELNQLNQLSELTCTLKAREEKLVSPLHLRNFRVTVPRKFWVFTFLHCQKLVFQPLFPPFKNGFDFI